MDHAPSDADGLYVPAASPAHAWTAVNGLRALASTARDAGRRLAVAPSAIGAWQGGAAAGFAHRRAVLSGRVADLATVSEQAAAAVEEWLFSAQASIAAMRAARDQVEAARAAEAAATSAGLPWTPARGAATTGAWRAWTRAKHEYWSGVDETGARLGRLRDGVRGHPSDATDHVDGFFGATLGGLRQDVAGVWGLTGKALTDRDEWWDGVSSLPGQVWDGLTGTVHDPVGAASALTDADAWQHGRYGEALGTAAALLVPSGRKLELFSADAGAIRFAARMADRHAPLPRLQTVDEMLDGVDLASHEHHDYGHAIRRHVAADDDYLADRLRNGTLLDDASRGFVPSSASTFPDVATANEMVTRALRANADEVRQFAAGQAGGVQLTLDVDGPIGKVMQVGDTGGFRTAPGDEIVVTLGRAADGSIYVRTAYPSIRGPAP